ncbi:MAG: hypothetical protein FGM14_16820 [Flavobacteriales bacterium]|nr:hypothetical protein [Flavobacteriales bacterium]
MNILDKFNMIPLDQLPQFQVPPTQVPKEKSIMPFVILGSSIVIIGLFLYAKYKNEEKENNQI